MIGTLNNSIPNLHQRSLISRVQQAVSGEQTTSKLKEGSRYAALIDFCSGPGYRELSAGAARPSELQGIAAAGSHLGIHPTVDKFLQAGLAAKVFDVGVVGRHVFPGIDFEHLVARSLVMRAVRLAPRQPPMVHVAFLFSADVAVEGLRPGHFVNLT